MKKYITLNMHSYTLVILLTLLPVVSCYSQKHEIKVLYSPVSLLRMDSWKNDSDGANGSAYKEDPAFYGALMMEYNRYIEPWVKLGINVGVDYRTVKLRGSINHFSGYPDFTGWTTFYTQTTKDLYLMVAPQLLFEYYNSNGYTLGSGIAFAMIQHIENIDNDMFKSRKSDLKPFFHIELLNFKIGEKNGLTGQLGFGHKGLFNIGYFWRW
ncbi:MAG: hypothetical protein MI866_13320 [Bacteroidales bacterium]|nr:hypothetical protein [Bacteroidales bacterium]